MGPKNIFIIFFLTWYLGLGGYMWCLFGQNIDFEAKISHFRQLEAKVQEITVFGLKINILYKQHPKLNT